MKKLKVQEMIAVGVYTTIYFLVVCLVKVLLKVTVPVVDSLILPGVTAVFAGVVYLLLLKKAPRFGAISVMGSVMGLLFLVTGHFPLAFLPSFVCAILADVIQHREWLTEKARTLVSYTVFSFGLTGPLLPLWFMKNAYVQSLIARGKDQVYIDKVFAPITAGGFIICVVTVVVGSYLGLVLGRKLLAKHFQHVK